MRQITMAVNPDAPAPGHLWEISYDGKCPTFHATSARTAAALTDILTRRLLKGWPPRTLTVKLLDEYDNALWDATADVAAVLATCGWPGRDTDRTETISLLEAVLVDED